MKIRLAAAAACGFACFALAQDPAVENIVNSRQARVDQARRQYEAVVTAADRDAQQRLSQLLSARTSAGDARGAEAVRAVLANIETGGAPATQQSHATAAVEQRVQELYRVLVAGDLDRALKYVDPKNLSFVQPATAKAFLGIWSGALKLAQVNAGDLKVERVRLGVKGNEAVVESRLRVHGKWDDQKPTYWVNRDGQWYIGDDKEIANFK